MDKLSFPLKVGIVGSGWVAINRHIPSYRKDPRVRISTIIDRNTERARKAANLFGIEKTFSSVDDVDIDLDLVSICTPPFTHQALAIACMQRGWHTLVEKPMAMTVSDADSMIKSSEESSVKLCVVHNFLFSHSMTKVKELIAEGRLGQILSVEILQTSNLRRHLPNWFNKLPGGLFFDEAPHSLYMTQFFLNDYSCVLARAEPWDSDVQPIRSVDAFFENNHATGHFNMLFNAGRDEWITTVVGTKSTASIDMFRDKVVLLGPGGRHTPYEVLTSSATSILQEMRGTLISGMRWATGRLLFGQDKLVRSFIDSITRDSEPPVSGHEGKKVVAMLVEISKKAGFG